MAARTACARLGRIVLLTLLVTAACTTARPARPTPPPSSPVQVSTPTTFGHLRRAFARWRTVPVTVSYRTERQRPGLPMSAHQCLRGFVDEREDIPDALVRCDPGGTVRLRLLGRGRWSMDVHEGGTRVRAIVDRRRGLVCVEGDLCRRRDASTIVRTFPFHELVGPVDRTVEEIGIDPSGTITVARRRLSDLPVQCFEVASATASVRWCFDGGGVLRALRIRMSGRAPTIVEADRVSTTIGGDTVGS